MSMRYTAPPSERRAQRHVHFAAHNVSSREAVKVRGHGFVERHPHDQGDKQYDQLSEELFALLNRTYVAVANTTAATVKRPSAAH